MLMVLPVDVAGQRNPALFDFDMNSIDRKKEVPSKNIRCAASDLSIVMLHIEGKTDH